MEPLMSKNSHLYVLLYLETNTENLTSKHLASIFLLFLEFHWIQHEIIFQLVLTFDVTKTIYFILHFTENQSTNGRSLNRTDHKTIIEL